MFLPNSDHVLSCIAGKTHQSHFPGELRRAHVTGEYIGRGREELDICMSMGLMRFGDGSKLSFR